MILEMSLEQEAVEQTGVDLDDGTMGCGQDGIFGLD